MKGSIAALTRRLVSRALEPRFVLPVLLLVAALLLFGGLGARYLWDDEAETALLARSIVAVGLPIARDGRDVISQGCGLDADQNYLWAYHPWLPMYLTAASFAVLGESTFAARLPFALLGLGAVFLVYLVARRLFEDRVVAFLAGTTLALSVPFLLHARQSRYYAISIFAAVWMIGAFVDTARGRRLALVSLVAASTAMLHANHGIFVGTFVALAVAHALCFGVTAGAAWRVTSAGVATLALNWPWLVIYGTAWMVSLGTGPQRSRAESLSSLVSRLGVHLARIDNFLLPGLLVLAYLVWLAVEGRRLVAGSRQFRTFLFLATFAIVHLAFVAVFPFTFLRYVLALMPALAMLEAFMLRSIARRRPLLATLLFVAALGTDALHGSVLYAPLKLRGAIWSPIAAYVGEITHDFHGPIEALVQYLRANARPDDTVFITYGDMPLKFYTALRVSGGQTCERPPPFPPDWIVVRPFFRFKSSTPGVNEDAVRTREYFARQVPWREYRRIVLPVVDIVWDSIPEPQWHRFSTTPLNAGAPPLVLYRRVIHDGGSSVTAPRATSARLPSPRGDDRDDQRLSPKAR